MCRDVRTNIPKPALTQVLHLSNTLSHELPGSQGVKASQMSSLIFHTEAGKPVRASSVLGSCHGREQSSEHICLGF